MEDIVDKFDLLVPDYLHFYLIFLKKPGEGYSTLPSLYRSRNSAWGNGFHSVQWSHSIRFHNVLTWEASVAGVQLPGCSGFGNGQLPKEDKFYLSYTWDNNTFLFTGLQCSSSKRSPVFPRLPAPLGKRLSCRIMTNYNSAGNKGWGEPTRVENTKWSQGNRTWKLGVTWRIPAPTLIQWPALTLLPACDHSAPETEPHKMQVLMEIENTQGICCCQDACDRRTINYTWETSYCMFNPEGEFPSTVPTTSSKSCGQLLPLSLFQHSIFILPRPSISPTLTIPISEMLNDLLFPLLLKRSL